MGKRIVKLSENDLNRLVKKVIKEQEEYKLLNVPEEYDQVIADVDKNPSPEDVMELWNGLFDGDAPYLEDFDNGVFINEDGDEVSPEQAYMEMDDYMKDEY
jgi:hypothetical protein